MSMLSRGWRHRAVVPVLFPVLLAAVACGPGEKNEPPVKLDACALLSPKDVEEIVGWAVVTGSLSSTLDDAIGRDPSRCAYSTGTNDAPAGLVLEVRQFPNEGAATRAFASSRSGLAHLAQGQLQDIGDVGSEAAWVGSNIQQLHVRQGRFYLLITAQTGDRQLLVARQIADRALRRLPKPAPAAARRSS
jgi:hypothetical protein